MQAFLQAASMMSREDEGGMITQLTRVECGGSHTYNKLLEEGRCFNRLFDKLLYAEISL